MVEEKQFVEDKPRHASTDVTIRNDNEIAVEGPVEEEIDAEAHLPPAADQKLPEPPPNGGLRAWLVVLGSYFLCKST